MPQPALCASFYPQSVIAASARGEGRREGERAGGRAGEGGGLGEGAAGRGAITKGQAHKPPRLGLTGRDCGLFSLKHTHTRSRARTHTHTQSPPSLSRFPSVAVLSLLALFPPESARGASARTALGRGSRREGPAARPKIRPQPRPKWPGPRPSGWAPGPAWGHRPAVPRLCPHPGPPDPPQHPQVWPETVPARSWGVGVLGRSGVQGLGPMSAEVEGL